MRMKCLAKGLFNVFFLIYILLKSPQAAITQSQILFSYL